MDGPGKSAQAPLCYLEVDPRVSPRDVSFTVTKDDFEACFELTNVLLLFPSLGATNG
jgi:hypothetical protein